MIDINTIIEPDFHFNGFKNFGYRQDSPEIGLKTSGHDWACGRDGFLSLADLRVSHEWITAKKEFSAHQKAAEIGIAPKVYSLTSSYNRLGRFVPCIKMEHVKNSITLYHAYVKYDLVDFETAFDILLDLHKSYAIIGLRHEDAHGQNVLLCFDREKKYIHRQLFIDFEYVENISSFNENLVREEIVTLLDDYTKEKDFS